MVNTRWTSSSPRFQFVQAGRPCPHPQSGRYAHRIKKLTSLQPLAKFRDFPITGVRQHHPTAQAPRLRCVDQFQRQLPLGLELHLRGDARFGAPLGILRPAFRQIEPPAQDGTFFPSRLVQAHRDLAVGRLAQRARILPRHPHGVVSLLGETRVVDDPHRIGPQLRGHALRQTLPNRSPRPGTLSDQLLHRLHVSLGQTRRHRLDRFALAVQQQAAHVYRAPVTSLPSPQRLHQVGQELFQALSTFRDFALGHGPELSTSPVREVIRDQPDISLGWRAPLREPVSVHGQRFPV